MSKSRIAREKRSNEKRLQKRAAFGVSAGVAAVAGLGVAATSAQAVDFTVTTSNDTGLGSLRAAINSSNLTPAVADRILFASSASGTINLASSLPLIQSPVEIKGPGKTELRIDGHDLPIFKTYSPLTISGMTLADGRAPTGGAIDDSPGYLLNVTDMGFDHNTSTKTSGGAGGGAIYIDGPDLTVSGSSFTGNYANRSGGAIASHTSKTTISGSTFTGNGSKHNGGAVYAYGNDHTVTGSTFTGNETQQSGGAIMFLYTGDVAVAGTSFTGNSATFYGGGVFDYSSTTTPDGGSLAVDASTFDSNSVSVFKGGALDVYGLIPTTISNATVTGNDAQEGGAIASYNPTVTVDSSTITGNRISSPILGEQFHGAGLEQEYGAMKVTNSIVTGNTPQDVSTFPAQTGPPNLPKGSIQSSFDLIGNPGSAAVTETVAGSNLPASTDPLLNPLADNGGPTETMLPKPASPVIDKGFSPLTVDQRGLTRPVDFAWVPNSTAAGANGADLGAVEVQTAEGPPKPPPVVPDPSVTLGKLKLNRKTGTASLAVTGNQAGAVTLLGTKLVAGSKATLKAAGSVNLTVRAKGKAARQLNKNGKATVKATVSFAAAGKSASASRSVKLVKKKKHRKK